jgi:hypothetical protein
MNNEAKSATVNENNKNARPAKEKALVIRTGLRAGLALAAPSVRVMID